MGVAAGRAASAFETPRTHHHSARPVERVVVNELHATPRGDLVEDEDKSDEEEVDGQRGGGATRACCSWWFWGRGVILLPRR